MSDGMKDIIIVKEKDKELIIDKGEMITENIVAKIKKAVV